MSGILVVVPQGWTDETEKWNNSSGDMLHISMLINDKNWADVRLNCRAQTSPDQKERL